MRACLMKIYTLQLRQRAYLAACASPFALFILCCLQIYATEKYDLSRWKGGAFGMFASIDNSRSRFLRIYLRVGKKWYLADMGKKSVIKTYPAHYAFIIFPSETHFERLSHKLINTRWIKSGRYLTPDFLFRKKRKSRESYWASAVRVEFWKVRYNMQTKRLEPKLIRTLSK